MYLKFALGGRQANLIAARLIAEIDVQRDAFLWQRSSQLQRDRKVDFPLECMFRARLHWLDRTNP
ncbi:MAG: hypothetical protein ABIQ44_10415, partial [Chloroflexia bacterium]